MYVCTDRERTKSLKNTFWHLALESLWPADFLKFNWNENAWTYLTQLHCVITVHLLTHVLGKPTHFFFYSFIFIMSYSLQTSFGSFMKDWPDKYHVWGTPTRQPSKSNNSNMCFFTLKRNTYTWFLKKISVVYIYMSYHTLFYHIPHIYGMYMSLEMY